MMIKQIMHARTTANFIGPVLTVDLPVTLVAGRDALVTLQTLVLIRPTRGTRAGRCYDNTTPISMSDSAKQNTQTDLDIFMYVC